MCLHGMVRIKQSNIFAFSFSLFFALCGGDCISYSFIVSVLSKWELENLKKWKNLQLVLIRNETGVFLIGSVMSFQETLI